MSKPEKLPSEARSNFYKLFIDAAGYPLGFSFCSPQTILPLFLSQLGAGTLLIGLIAAIDNMGIFVPQLFGAHFAEKMPVKKHFVMVAAMVERVAILGMGVAAFWLGAQHPTLLIALFFLLFATNRIAQGLNMPAYYTVVSKTVAANLRGRLYGWGGAVGGIFATVGAAWAGVLLGTGDFRLAYGTLFTIASVILTITVIPLGFVKEPADALQPEQSVSSYLRKTPTILRRDTAMRWYTISQALFAFGGVASAFFTIHAVSNLQATAVQVAAFTAIVMGSGVVANIGLGTIADRKGYKGVMLFGMATVAVSSLAAAYAPSIEVMYLVFALNTIGQTGAGIGLWTFYLELAPQGEATAYTAVGGTFLGPFRTLAPIAAGLGAARWGLPAVFVATALVAGVSALALAYQVPEPRFTRVHKDAIHQ